MYKLVIADDEDFIREQLIEMLSWKEFGFDVVASFEDGSEVIEYLKENEADVVLADIKMKNVSGIEIAQFIYHNEINTEVILISGYKDFEYARQALKFGVFDYLSKPTTYSEITATFKRVYEKLNVKYATDVNQLAIKQLFFDILSGLGDMDELRSGIEKLKLDIDLNNLIACIVTINFSKYNEYIEGKWKYGKEGFYNAVHNIVDHVDGGLYFSVVDMVYSQAIVLVIGTFEQDSLFEKQTEAFEASIRSVFEQNLNLEVQCKAHEVCRSIHKISESYKRIMSNNNHHITAVIHNIISHISVGNDTGAISMLNNFLSSCSELKEAYIFANSFAEILKNTLNLDTDKIKNELTNAASISAVENIMAGFIQNAVKDIEGKNLSIIDMAISYIQDNYSKDISLEDVAAHVALNPAYFSRYFKQNTGERFMDYITNIRMEKAKVLLTQTALKVYEICDSVGYKNIQHFHRLFKNYTGSTPNEFRLHYGGGHG